MVLQAVALQAHGETDKAVQLLGEALALAEPGGFIRIFVDEGAPMAELLPGEGRGARMRPDYTGKLLGAVLARMGSGPRLRSAEPSPPTAPGLDRAVEPARAGSASAHGPGAFEWRD